MELVPPRPNVELSVTRAGQTVVVFAFPYESQLVNRMRAIPGRKFNWDAKEWIVPQDERSAPYVAEVIERHPELVVADEVRAWLGDAPSKWIGHATAARHAGRGRFVVRTLVGEAPGDLVGLAAPDSSERMLLLPFTRAVGEALLDTPGMRMTRGASRSASLLAVGMEPPPAELVVEPADLEDNLRIEVLWDQDARAAFSRLPGNEDGASSLPPDPALLEPLEAFLRTHAVQVADSAVPVLEALRVEHDEAVEAIRRSRAREAPPLDPLPRLEGGTLAPFQWAGVRYVLEARRTFLADEQGLGKTIQALAALEAEAAFPAVVVCPASLKLNWEREAERWLPHRTRTVVSGRESVARRADLTILNYEIVADHRTALLRAEPRALVLDESQYVKNARAKRTRAVRKLAEALPQNALRVALSGTPVLNRPEELVSQLRILGRLDEFGSGARFARRFRGINSEERLHWHLRRNCFVRRLKRDVLPQLPAKRHVVVPMALGNEREYRLAEKDVIAWLREQPLDLSELDSKIAAALRAERLAQLTTLKRLAARGKLGAATGWIEDFLASGEPLVVFAHHIEVLDALMERFPDAGHLLGRDSTKARDATVQAFQDGTGPPLLIGSTLVAGQGITLTRASNVVFLELEWTPALHDQAEDRCHRIGQHDAVTAWYLLAADTIDETITDLLQRKRGIVAAVTDGRRHDPGGLVDDVVASLRDAPLRHLRPVA